MIQDLSFEQDAILGFQEKVRTFAPQIVGFTGYSSQSALVKTPCRASSRSTIRRS